MPFESEGMFGNINQIASRVGNHDIPSTVQWATGSGVLALGWCDGEAPPPHPFGPVGGREAAAVKDQCWDYLPNAAILSQNAAPRAAFLRNLFSTLRVFVTPCETYPPPPCDGEGARPFGLPSEA